MLGDYQGGYSTFHQASALDELDHAPLYGMIFARIKQDQFEDAQH